jgi:hypothetical protein
MTDRTTGRDLLGAADAPALPPEVRERALRTVLDGMDRLDELGHVPPAGVARRRAPRWAPLLTAAAVLLVAAAVVATTALVDPVPRLAPPAAGTTTPPGIPLLEPLPLPDRPAPSGDAAADRGLLRCATAAVRSARADQYPPTAQWRVTGSTGFAAFEAELTINDAFVCALTPDSVILSGTSGRVVSGVGLVSMSSARLVLLNPNRSRIAIGYQDTMPIETDPVIKVDLDPSAPLAALHLVVDGMTVAVPQPLPAFDLVDQQLPHRADTPAGAELAGCLAATPGPGRYTDPSLWVPVGQRPAAPDAPPALVARIGDAAAGFCLSNPPRAPMLVAAALPPPDARPRLVARYPDTSGALLFTAPPDVTAMRVAAQGGTPGAVDCPIIDGLAMCTLDVEDGQVVVVTASTAADPQGVPVYWG